MLLSIPMELLRIRETLTCAQFIPRVRELESQGACYWRVKVLKENSGYEIQCDVPQKGTELGSSSTGFTPELF